MSPEGGVREKRKNKRMIRVLRTTVIKMKLIVMMMVNTMMRK